MNAPGRALAETSKSGAPDALGKDAGCPRLAKKTPSPGCCADVFPSEVADETACSNPRCSNRVTVMTLPQNHRDDEQEHRGHDVQGTEFRGRPHHGQAKGHPGK